MSIELILLAVNINFVAFSRLSGRSGRAGVRAVRADGGGGRGGHRACHPGRLFPQPRHDRGGRRQPDEGLTAACIRRSSFFPSWARSSPGSFGRVIGHARVRARDDGAAVRLGGALLLRLLRRGDPGPCRRSCTSPTGSLRRFQRGLDAARRHADRGDAGGGDRRLLRSCISIPSATWTTIRAARGSSPICRCSPSPC